MSATELRKGRRATGATRRPQLARPAGETAARRGECSDRSPGRRGPCAQPERPINAQDPWRYPDECSNVAAVPMPARLQREPCAGEPRGASSSALCAGGLPLHAPPYPPERQATVTVLRPAPKPPLAPHTTVRLQRPRACPPAPPGPLQALRRPRLTAPLRQETPEESRDRQLRALGYDHLIR